MRIIHDNLIGKILKALTPLNLDSREIDSITAYFESDGNNIELLSNITVRNLCALTDAQLSDCRKLFESLLRKEELLLAKFANILFALGNSTAKAAIGHSYGANDAIKRLKELIDEEKYIALLAEDLAWNMFREKQDRGIIWHSAAQNPELLLKAMDYCGQNHDNSKVYIGMSLFHIQLSKKNALFKKSLSAEIIKQFENDFVPSIVDSLDNMLSGLTKSEITQLNDFIKNSKTADEKIDSAILSLCAKAAMNEYLADLLVSASALTWEWSTELVQFLRICTLIDQSTVVRVFARRFTSAFADELLQKLERILPLDAASYAGDCADNKLTETASRLYRADRDDYMKALETADIEQFYNILQTLKSVDPNEYSCCKDPGSSVMQDFRIRAAKELSSMAANGQAELCNFLLGISDATVLMRYTTDYKTLAYSNFHYYSSKYRSICNDQMSERLAVFNLLFGSHYDILTGLQISNHYNSKLSGEAVEKFFDTLESCGLTRAQQYDSVGSMYTGCYSDEKKLSLCECMAQVISKRLRMDKAAEVAHINQSGVIARYAAVLAYGFNPHEYKAELLACAADGSKQVRETLVATLSEQKDWEAEILEMLASKKSALRETAVEVICVWGAENYTELLLKTLEAEKSKKIRDRITTKLSLAFEQSPEQAVEATAEAVIKELHKGGKKRTLEWLYKEPMPEVRLISGETADIVTVQAVMLAYSYIGVGMSKDAELICESLNKDDLSLVAKETLSRWLDAGAEAKKKWVLYFAAIHGGAPAAQTLIHNINQWPLQARGAIAAEAVNALALSPVPSALLTVDSLSRKCKFKQVKAAAAKALKFAADQLGITTEQLADRIVPDLGFDSRMSRVFDYGTRNFTVRITPALDILISDENGKRLKNLPAVGQRDNAEIATRSVEEFKQLKKQIKAVVTTQKLRLELALSTGRRWTKKAWNDLFIKNPIMHQFAISLIWGTYDGEKLLDTFRYMEDGSFNTQDEEEYTLPEDAVIGLVHPIELDADQLQTWKQQLEDYEVTQSIDQLDRQIFRIVQSELECVKLERFGGKLINGLSLAGKLLGLGWYKGSVEDAGMYYTYYREDIADGISIQLHFSGNYVADQDEEVTIYEAIFYRSGSVKYGSYVYDTVKDDDCINLGDLPKRCFSEAVLQLEKATAASKETDESWRDRKRY